MGQVNEVIPQRKGDSSELMLGELSMDLISVVIPCYNESEMVERFLEVFKEETKDMTCNFEWWFINDGSTDETLSIIKRLASEDERVHYISFSRNFGKEAGLLAGLEAASGDYVVVMDVDLQDPPSLLPQMYELIQSDEIDCVSTYRKDRKGEGKLKSFFSNQFYGVFCLLSDIRLKPGARDFRLMTRQMVDAIVSLSEYNRFSKGIFQWVGFQTEWIGYDNLNREHGTSKWNFMSLFKYSLEGIIGFSTAPLTLASILGVLFTFIAFLSILAIIIKTVILGDPVSGWPSLACIIFFIGGLQLFCIGILGQYLSKTYLETKKRPIYVIREKK